MEHQLCRRIGSRGVVEGTGRGRRKNGKESWNFLKAHSVLTVTCALSQWMQIFAKNVNIQSLLSSPLFPPPSHFNLCGIKLNSCKWWLKKASIFHGKENSWNILNVAGIGPVRFILFHSIKVEMLGTVLVSLSILIKYQVWYINF